MRRILGWVVLGFLVLFMLAVFGDAFEPLLSLIFVYAGFGWLVFLLRVVPAIQWNPMAIATAAVCMAFLLVGMHRFFVWLSRSWQGGKADTVPWRKSWTISLVMLLMLAFIAGTAVVGATHQIAWLSMSTEPWVKKERRFSDSLAGHFALEIDGLRSANKPLPAEVFQRMSNEAVAADMRLVVLKDKDGLPWFVAVGAYDPGNPGWRRCAFLWWTGPGAASGPAHGNFTGDKWPALIAEAESGRPLDHFGR
jgi:hypothetical protein